MHETTPEDSLLAETLPRKDKTQFIVMRIQSTFVYNNRKTDLLDFSYVVFAIDTESLQSDRIAEVYAFINIRKASTTGWNGGFTFYVGLG